MFKRIKCNAIDKRNILSSTYRSLYDLGLLTSSYMERMFASTNFLRGVNYFIPTHFTHIDAWSRVIFISTKFKICKWVSSLRRKWAPAHVKLEEPRWYYTEFYEDRIVRRRGRRVKIRQLVKGHFTIRSGMQKGYRTLYFYNPLLLVFNLRCLSMYIFELSSEYGSVVYLNTAQYSLPIHYMMRWYARGADHSCIGTVWQGGTLSAINSRFLLVRSCLALPYQSYHNYASRWNVTFAQIITLIKILRHFIYRYECYGRIRKEINKIRKVFKMFYYYRYIVNYSALDSIVLLEPVYRRSYRMIREANNFGIPVIGSCSVSSTALWYDYWLPMDSTSPSSCVFLTSFVSNAAMLGHKLRGLSLFLKNAKYNKYC